MIRTALVAISALTALGIAHGASAGDITVKPGFSSDPYYNVQKASLRFDDIDLSSASGARVAFARIERAAAAVCGGEPQPSDSASDRQDFAECYAGAVRVGADNAHAAMLSAMARNQNLTLMAKN